MATKGKFQAIKGTRDLLPPETELWNRVESTAREVFGTYGFGEIRTPVFEATELFARSIGADTDVVSKEMYAFEDHEFQALDKLRATITYRNPDIQNQWSVRLYLDQIREFSQAFEQGIASQQIPRTPDNLRALTDLKAQVGVMEAATQNLDDGVQLDQARFGDQVALTKESLRVIHFGDVVTLRPEATAGICRAYIEHNMQTWPQPVKLYCLGPMFRRERPQKGRYRQFYQIDAEILGGNDAPGIDAEVIEMVMTFFAKLELPGVQLELNSIGHSAAPVDGKPICRRAYVEALKAALEKAKDKLGPDSQRRVETNPLRVLDSKLESEQAIIETLPRIGDHLCDECAKHYAEVKRQLEMRGVKYKENWRLVRGLDYYMRTTFEITARGLGSQNAVCGGGRYDGLIELLGGPPTKGIGFAIGEDRLILSLQEATKEVASEEETHPQKPRVGHPQPASAEATAGKSGAAGGGVGRDVYIAWMGEKAQATAIAAARKLREAGLRVELPPAEQKFGKALGQADKLGARYALILGEDEVTSGQWTVKTLADGAQTKVAAGELVEFLKTKKV